MSKWKFEPFVIRQYDERFDDYNPGPIFLGLQWVRCANERGLGVYIGPWYIALTWMRVETIPVYVAGCDCVDCRQDARWDPQV